jgi:hypothetical protein
MSSNRRIVLVAAATSLAIAATSAAQIDRNVSLINLRNTTGQPANDFHLILAGVSEADVMPGGLYGPDYVNRTVYTDGRGRVHIEWTGGSTAPGAWDQFGYALRGGVQYTNCEWYWTFNGQRIGDPLPDVFQDWVKLGTELRDVVRYRPPPVGPVLVGPISVQRTAGYRETNTISSFFDIFTELSQPSPPSPVPIDPSPVVMPVGSSLTYAWQTPPYDPWYFMFYDLYDGSGLWAEFSNVAIVVPEPGVMGLAAMATIALGRRRR